MSSASIDSPKKGPKNAEMFPFDDFIMLTTFIRD